MAHVCPVPGVAATYISVYSHLQCQHLHIAVVSLFKSWDDDSSSKLLLTRQANYQTVTYTVRQSSSLPSNCLQVCLLSVFLFDLYVYLNKSETFQKLCDVKPILKVVFSGFILCTTEVQVHIDTEKRGEKRSGHTAFCFHYNVCV